MRAEACLDGGGEMGALMRAHDWSATPLGPVAGWPQSLRTTVSTVLGSRFPTFIWWGPELVMLYNDGYRQILGAKHPASLGRPGREAWAEVWDVIGPMFESVVRDGVATWSEDLLLNVLRRGFVEECFFTFSYSPVRDESGGVGGVFCSVIETTTQVVDRRRLATLRELAARAVEAKQVEVACASVLDVLARNPADVPFAAIYLLDDGEAALAGACGLGAGSARFPARLRLDDPDPAWPLGAAAAGPIVVSDVAARFAGLEGGHWPEPPACAMVLPIRRAGDASERPYGLLVMGVSPRRVLDDAHRGFFDLVAGQLASAIASARAHAAERRRAEELAALDRAKTAFFSNVSHELRTPLTLLLGPTEEVLAGPDPLTGGQRERLEIVHRNALRLTRLVNTILDFSRIEAGRMRAAFEPTDLAALTADLASSFRSLVERAGLRLRVEVAPLPAPVHVDRELWEKIVLNLLSNAYKFTWEGEIAVTLAWRGDHVELAVRDTGVGIAADELPRVFDRFYRIEAARGRTHEGTGIGLAFVQELARLHGGTVAVESAPGRGSTFTVRVPTGTAHLPAAPVAAPATASTGLRAVHFVEEASAWTPATAPRPAPGPGRRARIVVADDNADMRGYLARILEPHHDVELVSDGQAALDAIRRAPPDLVVSDIMMPALDGLGLLRGLQADPALRGVPTILLSARAGDEARAEGIEAGASDYLIKPFTPRELLARVATQLTVGRLRALAELERAKLEQVFLDAPFAVALLEGPDLRVTLQNQRHREICDGRDLVGRPLFDGLPELRGQPIEALLHRVFATGTALVDDEVSMNLVRRGRVVPAVFSLIYQPVRDLDGNVTGVIAAGHEVTELVRARTSLADANRAKDEFLAMLGHELRNPLAPILTALELIRLRGDGRSAREERVIERQVRHLMRLVDDLLDVARIARGKIELRRERLALADVIAKAVEMASPLLEQRRHHLDVAVARDGLLVIGDGARLIQVIGNLLGNAAKYTPPGGRIGIACWREGDEVVIRVRDTGIGIPADLLPHVFDLFVQGARTSERAEGGLGLGLALVQSLVRLHGGTVHAASDGPGTGSELTVRLPAVGGALELVRGPAPSGPAPERAGPASRILVVDDNEDAAEMLAELLRSLGHEVAVAHDGPQALTRARAFRPTIAILDIGLPVMDGYELAGRLRAEVARELWMVAVTGYGQEHDRARSHDAGFALHLVKPVDLDRLIEAIEHERRAAR